MTVNISKPALNVREKLAELDKPTGIAGEAMLRAETPQEQFNLIGAGRRNLIINGDMRVAQRGTSFTNIGGYQLDRWVVGNPATNSVSQQFSTVLGMYYMDAATSAGWGTYQWIENVNARHLKAGDEVTVSYWTNVTSGNFNIKTSSTSPVAYSTTTIDTSSGWYRRSAVVTISSGQASDIASGGHLRLAIEPASNSFYLTGVQLELGKVATPFEHRSYGEELALCQRYYIDLNTGNYYGLLPTSGDSYRHWVQVLPVAMRASPSVTGVGGNGVISNSSGTNTTLNINSNLGNSTSSMYFTSFKLDAEL